MGSSQLTGLLVSALVVTLLAGAVLVRLVGDEPLPATLEVADATRSPDLSSPGESPRAGHPAPDFTLPDLQGQPVSLSDWRGRAVLINFRATWCAPCEVEMPAIQAVYEAHGEEGFVVLAVAVNDSAEDVRRFFEKYGLTLQPLLDDGQVSQAYRVFGLPTSFFVGTDGRIVVVHTGVLSEGKIESYVAQAR